MAATMKALIAYDGSACVDAALEDLKRAGMPGRVSARLADIGE